MWRGGLSAPHSAYLHAALPLIDEDATSPVLHEIVHVMLRARAGADGDGVVEGLAELYSLETLVRSRAISRRRYEHALGRLAEKSHDVANVAVDHSTGKITAKAVVLLHELDQEIARVSGGQKSLDDVMRGLEESPTAISLARFRTVAERVAGQKLPAFFDRPELKPAD
jgi:Flp pilus assembly protein TadB